MVTGVAAAAAVEAAVVLATVRTVAVLAEEVVCGEGRCMDGLHVVGNTRPITERRLDLF